MLRHIGFKKQFGESGIISFVPNIYGLKLFLERKDPIFEIWRPKFSRDWRQMKLCESFEILKLQKTHASNIFANDLQK